jgi:hypothetical protein
LNAVRVDWARPWLAHCRALGAAAEHAAQHRSVASALQVATAAPPVRFVAQGALHDFFNGLCWLRFPQTKRALNRLQAAEIARAASAAGARPGARRLTVFDENGALLIAPPPLWDALLARDWRACSSPAAAVARRGSCCSAMPCWKSC